MLTVLFYVVLWFLGAQTFYQVWLRRFPPKLEAQAFRGATELPRRWYVGGWEQSQHTNTWYPYRVKFEFGQWQRAKGFSLIEVRLYSFFGWVPVTLIIAVREGAILLAKMVNVSLRVLFPHPRDIPALPPAPAPDPYLAAALKEVEKIAAEAT